MVSVEVLETSELGDRSYVAHDGSTALVVDPQRDVERVERVLAEHGLTLAAVAETHVHNDYVTGGLALASRTGADYWVSAEDDVRFTRRPVGDGQELRLGSLEVRVVATPGHTHHHLTYVVTSGDHAGAPTAAFTGGSLLYGSVGRTDLLGPENTEHLTRAQFRSARRLGELLGDDARLYPTHGFGSFCSAGAASKADRSTMGEERAQNDALTTDDEDEFVRGLLASLSPYPSYYAHMGPRNLAGPDAPDLGSPDAASPEQLRRSIESGDWVVDLRHRRAFSAGHVAGSVGVELGSNQFSTYVGWLIPWGSRITLVGSSAEEVRRAQLQLARIGIERPERVATDPIEKLTDGAPAETPREDFARVAEGIDGLVLDVRQADERRTAAIPGSLHIPIHEVPDRVEETPRDTALWVHCATGFRAAIAAGFLERAGRQVVLVDDDFTRATRLGLTTG